MPDGPTGDGSFTPLYGEVPDTRPTRTADAESHGEDPTHAREPHAPDSAPRASDAPRPVPLTRRSARQAAAGAAAHDSRRPGQGTAAPSPPRRDADGALDDLFAGHGGTGMADAARTASGRRRRRWVALVVALLLVGGIGVGGVFAWNTVIPRIRTAVEGTPTDYTAGHAHGQAIITVVSGDDGLSISRLLAKAGVTLTSGVFYDMLVRTGQTPTFYPGVYRLKKEMTAQAALKALQDPANRLKDSVLLREGITESQVLSTIAQTVKMPLAQLTAAAADPARYGVHATSLEGWLFPAVYTFPPHATAAQIIQTMVNRTIQSLDADGVPVADRQRVLTIASIIQREARQTADFYKVSRVIQNRLEPGNPATGGELQMDSTAQYGYGQLHDGHASSSAAALASDNPWNTYMHPGLPVGPISSPGDLAINAALHPAPGPWLYFVTVNLDTGQTVFSTTYPQQQAAVAQMRAWCKANPNSGC